MFIKNSIIGIIVLFTSLSSYTLTHATAPMHAGAEIESYEYISKSSGHSKVLRSNNNLIFVDGKKVNSNNIEYIKARAYNHHDSDWTSTDDYRIFEKYDEGVNAYTITSRSPDHIGVLYLGKFNKDVSMGKSGVRKKGTVHISAYFLHCDKEMCKNPNLTNKYYYYMHDSIIGTMQAEIEPESDYLTKPLDLICKHTYTDHTNGSVEIN